MTKVELVVLADIDMLLIVKSEIKESICHSILLNAEENNKYMKNSD